DLYRSQGSTQRAGMKASKRKAASYVEMTREELLRELSTAEDQTGMVHELQVHQIELEMQNRELRETQQLLEDSRNQYADLYDFAPVGYCTLDPRGVILNANLTLSSLLNVPRGELIGKALTRIVPASQWKILEYHIHSCLAHGKLQSVIFPL